MADDAIETLGLQLATPDAFDAFPYSSPYPIQLSLMRHLYTSIESRSLAIIESPTGTGKTLSLLTAALTWLADDKARAKKGKIAQMKRELDESSAASEPDWVIEQSLARQKRLLDEEDLAFTARLTEARKREEIVRRREGARVFKKSRGNPAEEVKSKSGKSKGDEEDRFLPEDGTTQPGEEEEDDDFLENMSPEVREQMRQLKARTKARMGRGEEEGEGEDPICTKIFFASRTHTQLTQTTSELRRLKLYDHSISSGSSRPSHIPSSNPDLRGPGHDDPLSSELDVELETEEIDEMEERKMRIETRAVPLGSRKNLCINDELIASLSSSSSSSSSASSSKSKKGTGKENAREGEENGKKVVGDLDEACRELNLRPKEARCPFLPPMDEQSRLLDFRDRTLSRPRDIEDLVSLGRELRTCPYYGSRKAVNRAEIVTLPYNLLLQRNAREALGLDLKGHIVIVDEAHNLIDTVLSIHSHTLSSGTLSLSLAQLKAYYDKFRNKLSPKHALHLKRLVLFISALSDFCRSFASSAATSSRSNAKGPSQPPSDSKAKSGTGKGTGAEMMTVGDLVGRLGAKVDGFNLLEIVDYLRASKLARKITGYCDYVLLQQLSGSATSVSEQTAKERRSGSPPLHAVEAFLLILVDPSHHGRIFVEASPAPGLSQPAGKFSSANGQQLKSTSPQMTVTLKYQLLNPEEAFRDVVQDARAVILAGGTMTPMSDFTSQLFPYLPEERIKRFSCGHVIPPENLQTLVLTQGPRKTDLVWKFDRRGNQEMTEELGQMILNIATVVPNGLVVFFPSYAFLEQAKKVWDGNGLLEKRLSVKKKVFFEPREGSEVEALLREYSAAARGQTLVSQPATATPPPRGAILFAVVGAKVSEGLNFADELARAVVVVGLPFANLGSKELQERMRFVRERAAASGAGEGGGGAKGKDAGTELYENMCMKAVNQSIGRAIRHQSDWASLILIDQRYSTPRIQSKLPGWISGDIRVAKTWGEGLKELGSFYRSRKAASLTSS